MTENNTYKLQFRSPLFRTKPRSLWGYCPNFIVIYVLLIKILSQIVYLEKLLCYYIFFTTFQPDFMFSIIVLYYNIWPSFTIYQVIIWYFLLWFLLWELTHHKISIFFQYLGAFPSHIFLWIFIFPCVIPCKILSPLESRLFARESLVFLHDNPPWGVVSSRPHNHGFPIIPRSTSSKRLLISIAFLDFILWKFFFKDNFFLRVEIS